MLGDLIQSYVEEKLNYEKSKKEFLERRPNRQEDYIAIYHLSAKLAEKQQKLNEFGELLLKASK